MNINTIILWAVPFYIGVIVLEVIFSWLANKKLYNKEEALSNMAIGVVQQVADSGINLLLIPFYFFVYSKYKIFDLEDNLLLLLVSFIFKDFLYYWTHRLSHNVPLLWGIHIVHHQPKHFNFSVGLRAPLFHHAIDIFPMMLFAILGFPIETFVITSIIWISIQILNHTSLIKNEIPLLSWLFVTPSYHKIHHGMNDPYLNKNFGGIFSLWDKAFGTYCKSSDHIPIICGVKDNYYCLDPIGANFIYFKQFYKFIEIAGFSSIKMLMIITCGSCFILNAKQLNSTQTFLQSATLIIIFQIMTKFKTKNIES